MEDSRDWEVKRNKKLLPKLDAQHFGTKFRLGVKMFCVSLFSPFLRFCFAWFQYRGLGRNAWWSGRGRRHNETTQQSDACNSAIHRQAVCEGSDPSRGLRRLEDQEDRCSEYPAEYCHRATRDHQDKLCCRSNLSCVSAARAL
jgi:hypothetical protein